MSVPWKFQREIWFISKLNLWNYGGKYVNINKYKQTIKHNVHYFQLGEQNLLDKKSFLLDLGKYTNTFCQKMGCNTDIDIVIVGDERLKFEGIT